MTEAELLQTLARGEDSQHQFKRNATNADALAAELIAFANGAGGQLFIGVADGGQIVGLEPADIARLNQLLSNAASQNVRPPLNPTTANVQTAQGLVMVVSVAAGLNKPYVDTQGRIWVKSGADKRHVTAREEMQRLFQASGLVQADEVPAHPASIADLDVQALERYFGQRYGQPLEATGLALPQVLHNLNLARDGAPNLAGLLLFGKAPQHIKPAFVLKAVAFPGTVLHDHRYLDSETLEGPLTELYRRGMAFLQRNLHHVQSGTSFNSPSTLEIPASVFEELLVNALVHRDYFISAPIRLLVFADRVELISPGHLPDHLDAEQIRYGQSNLRNAALAAHAFHLLPYQGLGSGIPRAMREWPDIELVDDRRGNQFKAIVRRPHTHASPQVTPQVTPQVAELLAKASGMLPRQALMEALGLKDRKHFAALYLQPALQAGLMEMTLPDKPNSRAQQYRLTPSGQAWLDRYADKDMP